MEVTLTQSAHPLLELRAFITRFPQPLGDVESPKQWASWLALDAEVPLQRSEAVRTKVRELLRHGGFKPSGRSKPASEYLVGAVKRDGLGLINAAVDACNVVSLHSGFPIGVIDLDRAAGSKLHIGIAPEGATYVFNASGQEMRLTGLLTLADAEGPCGNPVKDSQRTKTHEGTRSTFTFVWGHRDLTERVDQTVAWYRALLESVGATTMLVPATILSEEEAP